jgi:hypothetical protein
MACADVFHLRDAMWHVPSDFKLADDFLQFTARVYLVFVGAGAYS